MFVSGWGHRSLSIAEVASAYGYPRYVHQYMEEWVFTLPPFRILLEAFRAAACVESLASRPVREVLDRTTVPPLPSASWIQSIQKWLPHSWTNEGTGSQQSIKRDDAQVPAHLWDQRILLLYPHATLLIVALRKLCFRRVCRNLLTDFRHYMSETYGAMWCHSWYLLGRTDRRIGGERKGRGREQIRIDGEGESEEGQRAVKQEDGGKGEGVGKGEGGEKEKEKQQLVDMQRDIFAAAEVLTKIISSSWWEWTSGSSLVFWRWSKEDLKLARDGMEPFIQGSLPKWKSRTSKRIQEPKLSLIVKKLETIVQRNYLVVGKVTSWTDFFDVPKGEDDIRLVYNGTSCGLNQALWVPNFWLPFPRSASRVLDYNSYSGDMDLGEMFHNFPLHETLQEYSGIDLSPFEQQLKLEPGRAQEYRWSRTWMGARSSPYSCVRYYYLAEEFIRGDHRDLANELRWDEVILNLPGDESYNPSKPRVQKWDLVHRWIAGELITFVDDGRAIGRSMEHTWKILRQVCSRIQYKGIQVALRKIHEPRLDPGPWAGAVFETTSTSVTKSVTIEKWNKGKRLVEALWIQFDSEDWATKQISYKELEITRGFLCHLSMTFESMTPYLKGFHLTLASYLKHRDKEGWKYSSDKAWQTYIDHQVEEGILDQEEALRLMTDNASDNQPPKLILPVKQLKDDIYALREFLSPSNPPKIQERSTSVQVVRYGFGDASGSGFGSTIETPEGLKYRIGVWGKDDDGESSNYKELANVVETVEEEAASGNLAESVLFFFTDNSTVEAALYKGNSSSRKLFLLVVRFRKLQFVYGIQIIVSHVSGKRMIQQGTDGVSRGNLNEGVGLGMAMIGFIPLHLSALQRCPDLRDWLQSWMGPDVEFLEPCDWFTRGHDHDGGIRDKRGFWRPTIRQGIFVWSPPPAAAEVALEELRKALIKRQQSTHVFVCPRLMTTEWLKQLYKASDLIIYIPAWSLNKAWSEPMHEPLTIGFVFPLLHCKPWQRKSTPQMFYVERHLSKVFEGKGMDSGNFLRSEQYQTEGLAATDADRLEAAWGTLQKKKLEFSHAREGDHLLVPFECDICIFQKLRKKKEPNLDLKKDRLLMACIRRINLDCFWSRASTTVLGNRDRAKLALRLSESVGLKGPFEHTTTLPPYDHCGYEVAIEMVLDSTSPGRYSQDHKQWDTVRKLRTVYSSQAKASPQSNMGTLAFSDDRGKAQRLVTDKCSSFWFSRFFVGCKRRMGQDWRPNKAFGIDLILVIIKMSDLKIRESIKPEDKHKWIVFGAYIVVTYVMSLRGVEGLLLDVKGLLEHIQKGDNSYFIVALLGKVKGEHHHRCHLLPCCVRTSSGIEIKEWVVRLLNQIGEKGFQDGPAIADESGNVMTCSQLDNTLIEILEEIYDESQHLFPPSITNKEEIATSYSVFRSLRRTSDTRAVEMNVSHTDIALFNRWSIIERAQGNRASLPMYQHYAQVELLVEPFKRYTYAM